MARPRSSFFLFGPRGVGKSTWTREKLAGAHRIALLGSSARYSTKFTIGRRPRRAHLEVDFLLQRGGELLAIEVKTSPRLQPAQLAGLSAIGELPDVVRRILVYGGTRRLKTPGGIEVWPLANFLAALEAGKLWP